MADLNELTEQQWQRVHDLIEELERLSPSERSSKLEHLRLEETTEPPVLDAVERWLRRRRTYRSRPHGCKIRAKAHLMPAADG